MEHLPPLALYALQGSAACAVLGSICLWLARVQWRVEPTVVEMKKRSWKKEQTS